MNNASPPNAYPSVLLRVSFERSDLYRDPNSAYWAGLFQPLARRLCDQVGRDAYDAWYDGQFPGEDTGALYSWKAKYLAVEAALKGQVKT